MDDFIKIIDKLLVEINQSINEKNKMIVFDGIGEGD